MNGKEGRKGGRKAERGRRRVGSRERQGGVER